MTSGAHHITTREFEDESRARTFGQLCRHRQRLFRSEILLVREWSKVVCRPCGQVMVGGRRQAFFKEHHVSGLDHPQHPRIPYPIPSSSVLVPYEHTHLRLVIQLVQLFLRLDNSAWSAKRLQVRHVGLCPVHHFVGSTTIKSCSECPIAHMGHCIVHFGPQVLREPHVMEHRTHCTGEYSNHSFCHPIRCWMIRYSGVDLNPLLLAESQHLTHAQLACIVGHHLPDLLPRGLLSRSLVQLESLRSL